MSNIPAYACGGGLGGGRPGDNDDDNDNEVDDDDDDDDDDNDVDDDDDKNDNDVDDDYDDDDDDKNDNDVDDDDDYDDNNGEHVPVRLPTKDSLKNLLQKTCQSSKDANLDITTHITHFDVMLHWHFHASWCCSATQKPRADHPTNTICR